MNPVSDPVKKPPSLLTVLGKLWLDPPVSPRAAHMVLLDDVKFAPDDTGSTTAIQSSPVAALPDMFTVNVGSVLVVVSTPPALQVVPPVQTI